MAKPPTDSAAVAALKQKVEEHEASHGGVQVRWVNIPKDVPAVSRRKGLVGSAVIGDVRQYAFDTAENQEQFVYDRNDAKFTVSRDIRGLLGLSPAVGIGTMINGQKPPPPPKKRNKFRKQAVYHG